MTTGQSLQHQINYAFTLGLQYTGDEKPNSKTKNLEKKILNEMGYVSEPLFVYTIAMKFRFDGIDWRREQRWKNVKVSASDGSSMMFHGTLLRSASDYFSMVSLSYPNSPVQNLSLPMLKKEGLLVLHDLIYKGYATIPRNMVIDILVQLSEIDPTIIRPQVFNNPEVEEMDLKESDYKDNDPEDDDLSYNGFKDRDHSDSKSDDNLIKSKYRRRLRLKRKMYKLFRSSSRSRHGLSRFRPKMSWNITDIPITSQATEDSSETPSTSQVPSEDPPECSSLSQPSFCDSTSSSNSVPTENSTDEDSVVIIDLSTPPTSPVASPSKTPQNEPLESSSENFGQFSAVSSSPDSPESSKSSSSSLSPPESSQSTPTSSPIPPMPRRPTLIPPSMLSKMSKPSPSSPTRSPSPSPPPSPEPEPEAPKPYKRARMSTSRGSYLETLRAFQKIHRSR